MRGASVQTLFTLITNSIDLTHHTLTDPRNIIGFNHITNELMPENAGVGIISLDQFKVSAANAGFSNSDQSLVLFFRLWNVPQGDLVVFQPECIHNNCLADNLIKRGNCIIQGRLAFKRVYVVLGVVPVLPLFVQLSFRILC